MWRVIALLVLAFAIWIGGDSASATTAPSWMHGAPTVTRNVPLSVSTSSWCDGYIQERIVVELGVKVNACLFGDTHMLLGYVHYAGGYAGVVQLPYSNELHLLEGICQVVCQYSPSTDTLVTKQRVGQFSWGVVVYSDVSNRVRRTQGDARYAFDTTSPTYEMKNDSGVYVSNPSFAMSANGRWIVTELQDKGLALVDTEHFTTKQIVMSGPRYGFGSDPVMQLAVSDNGKSVAMTGMNVRFNVIEVNAGCGQKLAGDLEKQPTTTLCKMNDFNIGNMFPNYYTIEQPRFYGEGYQLEFIVKGWVEADKSVRLLASGATPVHKLKLLALGDSFTSGEGEVNDAMYRTGTNIDPDICHVSKRSYPFLIAERLGMANSDVRSVACAGAQTTDIIGRSDLYWGQGERLKKLKTDLASSEKEALQIAAADTFQPGRALQSVFIDQYDPEKIVIGIGGNDAGLMGKLRVCLMPGTCEWAEGDGLAATAGEMKRLYTTLGALFAQIARSSTAQVYVAGYPSIIHADGVCDLVTGMLLDHKERVFMERSIEYLNQIIRAAAKKAEFTYLDVEQSMNGRRLCSGDNSVAMNGLRFGGDIAVITALPSVKVIAAESFHPTPTGHSLVADAILAGHPELRPDSSCKTDPMFCGVAPPSIDAPAYWGGESAQWQRASYKSDFVTQSDVDDRLINIQIPVGTLESNADVQIEIRSQSTSLGSVKTDDGGGLAAELKIPNTVASGFHTAHLYTRTREGKLIDMYQFVSLGDETVVSPANQASIGGVSSGVQDVSRLTPLAELERAVSLGIQNEGFGVLGASSTPGFVKRGVVGGPPKANTRGFSADGLSYTYVVIVAISLACLSAATLALLARRWAKPSS